MEQLGTWVKRGTEALLPSSREEKNGKLIDFSIEFSWDEVRSATSSFAEPRALGKGAAGTVFSGVLRDGTDVAIKLLECPDDKGVDGGGFEEEVRLLSRCRHPNLVLLLGFAKERGPYGKGALVYELLPGGDLHARLQKPQYFIWHERLRIAIDAARGLSHLHAHTPEVFHRDIKTANILLDGAGNGKMADFGLACMCPASSGDGRKFGSGLLVDKPAGTPGYADPLYAVTRVISEASEVYSLGMVFLEVLCCRPPAIVNDEGRIVYLIDDLHLRKTGAKHRVLSYLDRYAQWPAHLAAGLVTLTLLCVHQELDRRPCFLEVVSILHGLAEGENLSSRALFAERKLSVERQRSGSSLERQRSGSFSERQSVHELSAAPSPHAQPRVQRVVGPSLVANGVPLMHMQNPANICFHAAVPGHPLQGQPANLYPTCTPQGPVASPLQEWAVAFKEHKDKAAKYPQAAGLAPVPEARLPGCEVREIAVADLEPANHAKATAQHGRKKRGKRQNCGECGF